MIFCKSLICLLTIFIYVSVWQDMLIYRSGPEELRHLITLPNLLVGSGNIGIISNKYMLWAKLILFSGEHCNGWEVRWANRFIFVCSEGTINDTAKNISTFLLKHNRPNWSFRNRPACVASDFIFKVAFSYWTLLIFYFLVLE